MSVSERTAERTRRHWRAYWAEQTDGAHRSSDTDWLAGEAAEQLFHLGEAPSLLDFGCGAGELLAHLAPHYDRVIGADFSAAMLSQARKRLDASPPASDCRLIEADDRTVWDALEAPVDRISATGVVQYFGPEQLDRFISGALARLREGGRLILFDVIDPRLLRLYRIGALRAGPDHYLLTIAGGSVKALVSALARRARALPADPLGWGYLPDVIETIAQRHAASCRVVSSMHYEYRYHAIIESAGSEG